MKVKRQQRNLTREWADIGIHTNIQNGKVDSVWSSTPPKIRIGSKKASNKTCLKLNFVQKNLRAHMSIFPRSGARGLERFPFLKNYYVQKRGSRFSLGLDAAKNMHRIKKSFKQKLFEIEFRTQKSSSAYVCLPPEWN